MGKPQREIVRLRRLLRYRTNETNSNVEKKWSLYVETIQLRTLPGGVRCFGFTCDGGSDDESGKRTISTPAGEIKGRTDASFKYASGEAVSITFSLADNCSSGVAESRAA
jgi:hypothetical protein